ncbi:MAG: PBECR2 nuclease fold domain-containing protein [Clostridia bacterium]
MEDINPLERLINFSLSFLSKFFSSLLYYINAITSLYNSSKKEYNIQKNRNSGENNLIELGKIDIEKYKCVSKDITTNKLIITENQVLHIKEHHPNDYERFSNYLLPIVNNPDYILEANRPNTAFILKKITENGEHFQLILRLKTSSDQKEFSNSIITFLKVSEKKWNKYLRNKKILYKSE